MTAIESNTTYLGILKCAHESLASKESYLFTNAYLSVSFVQTSALSSGVSRKIALTEIKFTVSLQ